jgi:hypothetical protein
MTRSSKLFAALALAASFAGPPGYAAENGMVGRWFTEGVEKGVHLQVFLENKSNGSYVKDVRAFDGCDVAGTGQETGKWTFEKGDFATESEMLDGKPVTGSFADTHDLFTVTRVDDTHINLYDTETNITWALSKVAPSYSFPPARGCSV